MSILPIRQPRSLIEETLTTLELYYTKRDEGKPCRLYLTSAVDGIVRTTRIALIEISKFEISRDALLHHMRLRRAPRYERLHAINTPSLVRRLTSILSDLRSITDPRMLRQARKGIRLLTTSLRKKPYLSTACDSLNHILNLISAQVIVTSKPTKHVQFSDRNEVRTFDRNEFPTLDRDQSSVEIRSSSPSSV